MAAEQFQSTPLREGRRGSGSGTGSGSIGFNPRPCARGDPDSLQPGTPGNFVSIHAPARGATFAGQTRRGRGCVSIHAPARGATVWSNEKYVATLVSIHAPARGATRIAGYHNRTAAFQSTPLREGRPSRRAA